MKNYDFLAGKLVFLATLILSTSSTYAQDKLVMGFSYGIQKPLGRLENRFGNGFAASSELTWHFNKSGLFAGLDGAFFFGDQVKEDVLSQLRTSQGFIYGNDKSIANIQLRMRGWMAATTLGKDWTLTKVSAIRIKTGPAYAVHRIRIQDDPQTIVPQLATGYKNGYDRLEGGPAVYVYGAYHYQSVDSRIRFNLGVELLYIFSSGLRSYQFDLMQPYFNKEKSLFIGIKGTWLLPLYRPNNAETWY